MQSQRILVALKLCALAVIAVGLLSGPASFRPEPQSAEAALLSEVKKLTASGAQFGDNFGFSVAVSGDTAMGSWGPANAEPPVVSMLVAPVTTPGWCGSDPACLTPVLRFQFEGTGPLSPLSSIPGFPASLVNDPVFVAFNSQGELFVANRHGNIGGGVGSIARFTFDAAGNFVANGAITGNSLEAVTGLAFSPTGELLAANLFNGTISRFLFDAAGNAIPNGTIHTGRFSIGLAFSPNGELFTTHDSSVVARYLFDPVTKAAIPNGSFVIPGSVGLAGLTFSAQGELFVADMRTDLIFRFVFDGLGNPIDNGAISPGVDVPVDVAFSSAGELFVSHGQVSPTGPRAGGIARFLFDVNGDAIPNGFTPTDHLGGVAIFDQPLPTPVGPPDATCAIPNFPFPGSGCDNFDSRWAVDVLFTNPPMAGLACSGAGPTQVVRYQDPFAPTDTDADTLRDFETEITFMLLEGTCQPGNVPFTVHQSPTVPSAGLVEEQSVAKGGDGPGGDFFPANSFFDVFFEVDTPLGTLHNNDPLRMECKVSAIPPVDCSYVPQPGDIDLFDETEKVVGVLTHGSHDPHAVDSDFDGCPDDLENGPNEGLGGQRDFLNFWDLYDTPDPNASPQRDRAITVADIFRVAARFGATDDNKTAPINRNTDPLSKPAKTGYHPAYDRGGQVGDNIWNQAPPDGAIAITDIFAVAAQFGHSCL